MASPPPVGLYDEALIKFRKHAAERYTESKEQQLLAAFLQERASPEATKEAAESLQADTKKKYGSKKVGDVVIPSDWIDKIMGNIGNFVAAGNMAMTGAPESVGIAWFAVKLTLTAIQNNYELYTFFGSGLADISEIMIIVRHYDRLYDERAKSKWKPSALVEKLFSDVVSAYQAVLDFSFAIKRHLTAGTLTRIKHGFKDFFGTSKSKFEGKLSTIATLKKKIVEGSQGAFQDKTLSQLEGVSTVLKSLAVTVEDVKQFQTKQEQWHKESTARLDTILQAVEDIKATTKRKTPWDYALETFNANRKNLKPLRVSTEALARAIDAIHPDTCQWIYEQDEYKSWSESRESTMLRIFGGEGTGKSTVLASITNHLDARDRQDEIVLYLSCQASATSDGDKHGGDRYDAKSICQTFLYQLYGLAIQGQENVHLLESCNEVFKNPKSKEVRKIGNAIVSQEENMPDFAEAFAKLSLLLKKSVVLVLDGINSTLSEKDQKDLAADFESLIKTDIIKPDDGLQMKVLVGCNSLMYFSQEESLYGESIDVEKKVREDIATVLKNALQNTPSLSPAEQKEAEEAIIAKAGPQFRYLCEVAIPFIREPFVRPLSKRLEDLPGGLTDKYSQALSKMKPNYVGLLHTALKWIVLGSASPTGRELMDAFYGTYDSAPDATSDADRQENNTFPVITRVELDQLRDASGPFLDSFAIDGGTDRCFYAREPQQVEEFCFNSKKDDHKEEHNREGACARCQSEVSQALTLSIDKREDHLRMAITCLRHLNHPLFQHRAGLLNGPASTEDAASQGPQGERPDSGVEKEKSPDSDGEEEGGSGSETLGGNHEGEATTVDKATEDADQNDTEGKEDLGDGFDHDSMDGEDWEEDEYEDAEEEEQQAKADTRIRYEIQLWTHHVRKAEDLWPEEERSGSDTWKELFDEFEKFASTTEVFGRWQRILPGFLAPGGEPHKPLHITAAFGLTSLVKYLIEDKGADPNEISRNQNALQVAALRADRPAVLELLLAKGVDVNHGNDQRLPAMLTWMARDCTFDTLKTFLANGADPMLRNSNKSTPLHYFAVNGTDDKIVDLLVDHGADINAVDTNDDTPLHYLLTRREVPKAVLSAFLDKGANVNAEDKFSIRPLQMAARWGEVEVLEAMLNHGVTDIDDPDTDGHTALYQAAIGGHAEPIRVLSKYGANPGITNKYGWAALHMAAADDHKACVQVLLDLDKEHHNAQLNLGDNHNRTPFFWACSSEDGEIPNLILDALVANDVPLSKINQLSKSGRSPLRQAADHGYEKVVARLIQLAIDQGDLASLYVNGQDNKKKMTPLHRAARNGHLASMLQLLDPRLSADIALKDKDGHTALDLAYRQWALDSNTSAYEDIISILIDRNPEVAKHDAELVGIIAANGSRRLLEQLWRHKADLNMRDQYGWTPLEIARKFSQTEAEKFLSQQLAWTNMLPSRWGSSFPSTNPAGARSLSEDGTTITHLSHERAAVASDRPLPAALEQYYFEVTLGNIPPQHGVAVTDQKEHPFFAIGFCTIGGAALLFPGWGPKESAPKAKSWGFHADDGGLYDSATGDSMPSAYAGLKYGPGDTVGCGVDFAKKKIFWTKNGKEVPGATFGGVDGRLFPVVGLNDKVYCEVNFGKEEFKWKGASDVDVVVEKVLGVGGKGGIKETVVLEVVEVDGGVGVLSNKADVTVSEASIVAGMEGLVV